MDDKVLIKSERDKKGMYLIVIIALIIGVLLSGIIFAEVRRFDLADSSDFYDEAYQTYLEHQENGESDDECYSCEVIEENSTKFGFLVDKFLRKISTASGEDIISLIPLFISIIFSVFVILWLNSQELTVTDRRVYGKAAFGNRVDLPIDSISAVSTSVLKGLAVGTSSGKISFNLIKNQAEIHALISKLLMERQKEEKTKTKIVSQQPNSTNADEIKKYKELLDSGTITQEEFDAKKKQLLGL